MHLIGWTLSTWPSLFHNTDWDADIDQSISVHFWYRPVYICAFILCVSDSGIQCNKHNSYWYVRQLVAFLILWKISVHLYCVSDSGLQCNKHNIYWYGGQYQDRQTAFGSWYGLWNWYYPRLWKYHFHWFVPWSLGSLYILILPSILVTII